MNPIIDDPSGEEDGFWSLSSLTRERLVEKAAYPDLAFGFAIFCAILVLGWAIIDGNPWAFMPLATIGAFVLTAPWVARRAEQPERLDFLGGVLVLSTTAVAAGIGGPDSPIAYLLPIGLLFGAMRGAPVTVFVSTTIVALGYLGALVVSDPGTLVGDPLVAVAVEASVIGVGVGSWTFSCAEIAFRRTSVLDPLTGLLSRRALEERFEELRQQAVVAEAPLSLVLMDIDHFKEINDRHGHAAGDVVLQKVAYVVRRSLRRFELVYRMGGEEFLVVLPGRELSEALGVAERLRSEIAAASAAGGIAVTASFGVSSDPSGGRVAFLDLYRCADRGLYLAKRSGRDQVSVGSLSA